MAEMDEPEPDVLVAASRLEAALERIARRAASKVSDPAKLEAAHRLDLLIAQIRSTLETLEAHSAGLSDRPGPGVPSGG